MNRRSAIKFAIAAFVASGAATGAARSASLEGDGVVSVKSAFGFDETIERLKADIADKKIMFFDAIDQAKLASRAGIELRPSTLLIFGNPPLGIQFLTSTRRGPRLAGPASGDRGRTRTGLGNVHGFCLDRPQARHRKPRRGIQDGFGRHRLDRLERGREIAG